MESIEEKVDVPEGTDFVAVKRIRNGGVLFELTSAAAAKWLQQSNNIKLFTKALGSMAEVKTRTYPVLAEFVPVTFRADSTSSWSEVETRNNLDIGNISNGRWIKPLEKRYQGQRYAHLIVNCAVPEVANTSI
ncbi:hypothetical protein OBBRIDRAFT_742850, partial [Obba rivulosa]